MADVLKEVFPAVDIEIIKALLEQCNGNTETAFELLSSMTSDQPSKFGPIDIKKNQSKPSDSIDTKFQKIEFSTSKAKDQIKDIDTNAFQQDTADILRGKQKKCKQIEEDLMRGLLDLDAISSSDTEVRAKRKSHVQSINDTLKDLDKVTTVLNQAIANKANL